jgi:hypothetical protein
VAVGVALADGTTVIIKAVAATATKKRFIGTPRTGRVRTTA